MNKEDRKKYEAPFTKKTQVEVEASMCAGSQVEIKETKGNVEVDDYASVENDVTFE